MGPIISSQEAYFCALSYNLLFQRIRREIFREDIFPDSLEPEPIILHDIAGPPLFYLFLARKRGGDITGSVVTSANPKLSRMIYASEVGGLGWSPEKVMEKAKLEAKKFAGQNDSTEISFVCYSYPKIGVLIQIRTDDNRIKKRILRDVADWNKIILDFEAGVSAPDGQLVTSILRWLPEGTARLSQTRKERDWYLRPLSRRTKMRSFSKSSMEEIAASNISKIHIDGSKSKILPVPLCGQKSGVWCAIASAQMILEYYGCKISQPEIAKVMNPGKYGTTNDAQLAAYKKILGRKFAIRFDSTAQWDEARDEINNDFPMKSGVPGHARVCCGWVTIVQTKPDGAKLVTKQLRINDPWPPNRGRLRVESWGNEIYTNYIYVRRK